MSMKNHPCVKCVVPKSSDEEFKKKACIACCTPPDSEAIRSMRKIGREFGKRCAKKMNEYVCDLILGEGSDE